MAALRKMPEDCAYVPRSAAQRSAAQRSAAQRKNLSTVLSFSTVSKRASRLSLLKLSSCGTNTARLRGFLPSEFKRQNTCSCTSLWTLTCCRHCSLPMERPGPKTRTVSSPRRSWLPQFTERKNGSGTRMVAPPQNYRVDADLNTLVSGNAKQSGLVLRIYLHAWKYLRRNTEASLGGTSLSSTRMLDSGAACKRWHTVEQNYRASSSCSASTTATTSCLRPSATA